MAPGAGALAAVRLGRGPTSQRAPHVAVVRVAVLVPVPGRDPRLRQDAAHHRGLPGCHAAADRRGAGLCADRQREDRDDRTHREHRSPQRGDRRDCPPLRHDHPQYRVAGGAAVSGEARPLRSEARSPPPPDHGLGHPPAERGACPNVPGMAGAAESNHEDFAGTWKIGQARCAGLGVCGDRTDGNRMRRAELRTRRLLARRAVHHSPRFGGLRDPGGGPECQGRQGPPDEDRYRRGAGPLRRVGPPTGPRRYCSPRLAVRCPPRTTSVWARAPDSTRTDTSRRPSARRWTHCGRLVRSPSATHRQRASSSHSTDRQRDRSCLRGLRVQALRSHRSDSARSSRRQSPGRSPRVRRSRPPRPCLRKDPDLLSR